MNLLSVMFGVLVLLSIIFILIKIYEFTGSGKPVAKSGPYSSKMSMRTNRNIGKINSNFNTRALSVDVQYRADVDPDLNSIKDRSLESVTIASTNKLRPGSQNFTIKLTPDEAERLASMLIDASLRKDARII